MSHSTTTEFLSKLSEGETICFKYSGGSWPGVPRTLHFHSWYIGGPVRGAYMTAYDSNGLRKMILFNFHILMKLKFVMLHL